MGRDEELAVPTEACRRPNLLQSGLGLGMSVSRINSSRRGPSENPLPLRRDSSRLDLSVGGPGHAEQDTMDKMDKMNIKRVNIRWAAEGFEAKSSDGDGDGDMKGDETTVDDSGPVDTPSSGGTTPLSAGQSLGGDRTLLSARSAALRALLSDSSESSRSQSRSASDVERGSAPEPKPEPEPEPKPEVEASSAEPAMNTSQIGQRDGDRNLDLSGTTRFYKSTIYTSPNMAATARAMATATATGKFPAADIGVDSVGVGPVADEENVHDLNGLDRLLARMPSSVWQPNSVVVRHRRSANCYWGILLIGYFVYIIILVRSTFDSRNYPPVQISLVEEPYELPDVGFCFEGSTYGSRFGCFDNVSNGNDCASSLRGDVFVYGYNRTGYTTPEGYPPSKDYVVLLPTNMSDTCIGFRLSTLTAKTDALSWHFHMLMFWNSSYDPAEDLGAFESIKMYLYRGGMTTEEREEEPITLYAPISFDASVVPFVRGFLAYEQHEDLKAEIDHRYLVVDTTSSPWHNAEDAVGLAAEYRTDALASIQLDIRSLSYYRYSEVDPVDFAGTLGEISGFWLVVPLLFGVLFYRPQSSEEDLSEMRSFNRFRWRFRKRGLGRRQAESQYHP